MFLFVLFISWRKNSNQEDTLSAADSLIDAATEKNLHNLMKIGEKLLKKPVSRVNFETGVIEPIENGSSNEEALTK